MPGKAEERIAGLKEGRLPFYQLGLEELVTGGAGGGRLSFFGWKGLPEVAEAANVVFVAVDTPQGEDS